MNTLLIVTFTAVRDGESRYERSVAMQAGLTDEQVIKAVARLKTSMEVQFGQIAIAANTPSKEST